MIDASISVRKREREKLENLIKEEKKKRTNNNESPKAFQTCFLPSNLWGRTLIAFINGGLLYQIRVDT